MVKRVCMRTFRIQNGKKRPLEAFKKKILLYVVMAEKPFQVAKSGFRGDFAHGLEGDL